MASPLRYLTGSSAKHAAPAGKAATSARPNLSVVPRRRRAASFAVVLIMMIAAVMMGAVFLHTQIAERQLEIDRLERSVRQAQADFDVLRAKRAELRAPTRLSSEARTLGLVPGSESRFVAVDPMTLAITIARTGQKPVGDEILIGGDGRLGPLDQFRLVKSVAAEAP